MKHRFTMAVAVAISLLASQGASSAQQAFTATTAPALVVKLSVVAAPGVLAKVALRNGEMGRWTMTDGSQYGLTPIIAGGVSQLYIFKITPGKTPEAERIQLLAKLPLALDTSVAYPEIHPLFEVTLLGTAPVPAKPPQTPTPSPTFKAPAVFR
jgi:predicted transporter